MFALYFFVFELLYFAGVQVDMEDRCFGDAARLGVLVFKHFMR